MANGVKWLCVAAVLIAFTARAEDGWETVQRGEITVKVRAKPGSQVQEVWAEATLAAPTAALQTTLLDGEAFPRFMPYVKENRQLGTTAEDGTWLMYTRVAPPVIAQRDYVVRVQVDTRVADDGTGEFKSHWTAVANQLPLTKDVVRIPLNEGSWQVVPLADGKSKVVYRFRIDPGGWVPGFIADIGNRSGVNDVLKAVEKEAQRRAKEMLGSR